MKKEALVQPNTYYIQLAKPSRRINAGAIFSAVSWSTLSPFTVLASFDIPECYKKVFFSPNFTFVFFGYWLLQLNEDI